MNKSIFLLLFFTWLKSTSQTMYFPPTTGNTWDTISPASIGWCNQPAIDSLYSFLNQTHTAGFIVLKNGKIVLEKYFGSFTADSVHYWASAGKSLMAFLTGIAQQKGYIQINSPVSNYLGPGWTAEPTAKESSILVRHLLTMTSGFNDKPASPCDNENTDASCLQYLTDTGMRWAYHTGAYQQLSSVISQASGVGINSFTNTNLGNKIGLGGLWVNGVFYSKARSMARFGLLALNKGIWASDTLIRDTSYFRSMVTTSQPYNQSYGYLWWLNGKNSYMAPGLQFVFNGSLMPHAPDDMFSALGKNDQKIYVVPSQQLVVIRTGESAYGVSAAFSPFDDQLWGKIDSLKYGCQYTFSGNGNWNTASNWTNNRMPPAELLYDATITINPAPNGVCILNIPQKIGAGTNLIIAKNAQFTITGSLTIIKP